MHAAVGAPGLRASPPLRARQLPPLPARRGGVSPRAMHLAGHVPLFARPPPLPRTHDAATVLGLQAGATPAAATQALHLLTLIYHPHNNGSPTVRGAVRQRGELRVGCCGCGSQLAISLADGQRLSARATGGLGISHA
jgi:hypothetical protein